MRFEGFSTENKRISKCISTTADDVVTDILKLRSERTSMLGLGLNSEGIIPVFCCALIGSPSEENLSGYKNALFTLRDNLIRSPKFLLFIPGKMKAPTDKEMIYFDAVARGSCDEAIEDLAKLINISNSPVCTEEARKIFRENAKKIEPEGFDAVFEYGTRIVTWLGRCAGSEQFAKSSEIPTVFFYGSPEEKETEFLHFMSRAGFDVLVVSTSKASIDILKDNNSESRMQIFEFPSDGEEFPFPEKLIKSAKATVAYSAEQELNAFMYSNTSIFRDFQFSDMQSLTLKTTYKELNVLWHQQARYRTGFDVIKNKTAVVPNIFAKISGVRDGDMDEYWDEVKGKLSPLTRIIQKAPSFDRFTPSVFTAYKQFYSGTKVDIESLKKSPYNTYRFLSDDLQLLIFRKFQEAVDSGWLMLEENELVPLVIYVGMALDREILKILQKFDFTKDIPKIVVIDAIEDTFSKVECIQLVLFNLLGFDIIVCTPTGYKNLETYISPEAFTTFTMNEYKYNIRIPRFKIPDAVPEPKDNGGIFNKLFKKGRK